jgi:signal transduction histidine kinase
MFDANVIVAPINVTVGGERMYVRHWIRAPKHLAVLFLAATVVPAAGLAWLGWWLLQQDRDLETQRIHERLDNAADLVTAEFARRLIHLEEWLPELAKSPPADLPVGAVFVTFTSSGAEVHPAGRLLYYPVAPRAEELPGDAFSTGENLEFQEKNYSKAAAAFRELARSKNPQVRAGALVRLARNLRKNHEGSAALSTYKELEMLGNVPVGGVPAELLGRYTRCELLEQLNRLPELKRAASTLYRDLQNGRWRLDRASYEYYSQQVQRWVGGEPRYAGVNSDALALSAAVESLWNQWEDNRRTKASTHGRRIVWVEDQSVLMVWDSSLDRFIALVANAHYLESEWQDVWKKYRVKILLRDSAGHNILGETGEPARLHAIRTAAEMNLPWTLRVVSADPGAELAWLAGRRRMLLAVLAIMALVVIGGGYFIGRAVTRELAVARMQSDFVSAVSHEFRSPLTSMRHMTELLEGDRVPSEDRRRQYYGMLSRETKRLHRLVEGLLNFGRMEARTMKYEFAELDPAELVRGVVAEFGEQYPNSSHRISVESDCELPSIRADHEALARAVWNLLDNAVKYSPGDSSIEVVAAREGGRVAIHVRDHGPGIPAAEQEEIFRKFARGSAASASHVKGTGIGLALVQHIVEAHNGEVRLDSEAGRESTFTILITAEEERA